MPSSGYFDTIFAASGTRTTVPDAIQGDGSVSYTQGYGALYSTAVSSGGLNFPRAQHNQVLFDITTAIQNWQQNTIAPFITSSMNGGSPFSYSAYNMVLSGGIGYISLVNSNADTPPSAKWATIPLGNPNVRTSLTANTDFFVATTGSDANNGLSSGTAWLTLQHAANVLSAAYDLNGFTATVHVADGTYTAGVQQRAPFTGSGSVNFSGNTTTPANVLINASSIAFYALNGAVYGIAGFKPSNSSSGGVVVTENTGIIILNGNMNFGVCQNNFSQIEAIDNGVINLNANYTVSAGGGSHMDASRCGVINSATITATFSGTPAFSNETVQCDSCGVANLGNITFSGAATGTRYNVKSNGVIDTNGGGANFIPGSVAGASASGGQYI